MLKICSVTVLQFTSITDRQTELLLEVLADLKKLEGSESKNSRVNYICIVDVIT